MAYFVIKDCTRPAPITGVSHEYFICLSPTVRGGGASLDEGRETWLLCHTSRICWHEKGLTEALCLLSARQGVWRTRWSCTQGGCCRPGRARTASPPDLPPAQPLHKPLPRAFRLLGPHSCRPLLLECLLPMCLYGKFHQDPA